MNDENWPFDQPRNCATVTLRQIIEKEVPILRVYHDTDDHGWQFLSNIETSMKDAMLVSLGYITELDPSVFEVSNIPPGYHVWRRTVNDDWEVGETSVLEEGESDGSTAEL